MSYLLHERRALANEQYIIQFAWVKSDETNGFFNKKTRASKTFESMLRELKTASNLRHPIFVPAYRHYGIF